MLCLSFPGFRKLPGPFPRLLATAGRHARHRRDLARN
jgi:hypothetical protein